VRFIKSNLLLIFVRRASYSSIGKGDKIEGTTFAFSLKIYLVLGLKEIDILNLIKTHNRVCVGNFVL